MVTVKRQTDRVILLAACAALLWPAGCKPKDARRAQVAPAAAPANTAVPSTAAPPPSAPRPEPRPAGPVPDDNDPNAPQVPQKDGAVLRTYLGKVAAVAGPGVAEKKGEAVKDPTIVKEVIRAINPDQVVRGNHKRCRFNGWIDLLDGDGKLVGVVAVCSDAQPGKSRAGLFDDPDKNQTWSIVLADAEYLLKLLNGRLSPSG